jgi:hypothetical protein
MLALALAASLTLAAAASAVSHPSLKVLVVNGQGAGDGGTLQEQGSVAGVDQDSFDAFTFSDLDHTATSIESSTLTRYDTVVLNEVFTSELTAAEKQLIADFVTGGGKLVILDADGTEGNEYSWLPVPAGTGVSCKNCGNTDGSPQIVENSELVSSDPASPDYVNVSEIPGDTDGAGDANVIKTSDARWDASMRVSNDSNGSGVVEGYANDGGVIVYDGLDTDDMGQTEASGSDWLGKLYYQALALPWDPDSLPGSQPIASGGGGPVAGCGREALAVGVVGVCADSINGSGSNVVATGNVTLDSGVAIGDGPVDIDESSGAISTENPAPISVLRSTGLVSLGTANVTIDSNGTTDPVSGESGLAPVTVDSVLGGFGSLTVGGIPIDLPSGQGVTLYLDSRSGGGVVGDASLTLPVLSDCQPQSLAVGLYAASAHTVVPIGGGLHIKAITLGKWGLTGLDLTYQSASDTWTASGGLTAPIGSLTLSGSLIGGQLNSLGASIGGQNVPLGDSGFFLTDFGGSVSGLAHGPLSLSASTSGFWGVPDAPVEPFYLKDVTLTVDFGGSVSLDGSVSFVLEDDSPVTGSLHLKLGLSPFAGSGSVSISASLPGLDLSASDGAAFTTHHFTAQGNGELSILLLKGSGEEVISDGGAGASGKLCTHPIEICQTLGFAATWKQLDEIAHGHASVLGQIIGADPQNLVTVHAAAAGTDRIRVRRHSSMLLVQATGGTTAPALMVTSPTGRRYRTSSRAGRVLVGSSGTLTEIVVGKPRPGTWRIRPLTPGSVAIRSTTLHRVRLLRLTLVTPRGSRRSPLGTHASVRIRWSSTGLPADTRVTILDSVSKDGLAHARRLATTRHTRGSVEIPARRLVPGGNYLVLVGSVRGVPFRRVVSREIWRKRTARHHHRRHRHSHR